MIKYNSTTSSQDIPSVQLWDNFSNFGYSYFQAMKKYYDIALTIAHMTVIDVPHLKYLAAAYCSFLMLSPEPSC